MTPRNGILISIIAIQAALSIPLKKKLVETSVDIQALVRYCRNCERNDVVVPSRVVVLRRSKPGIEAFRLTEIGGLFVFLGTKTRHRSATRGQAVRMEHPQSDAYCVGLSDIDHQLSLKLAAKRRKTKGGKVSTAFGCERLDNP